MQMIDLDNTHADENEAMQMAGSASNTGLLDLSHCENPRKIWYDVMQDVEVGNLGVCVVNVL